MGMLEGRVAVVTGGGRGIGAETAKLLAREGASVVVNDAGVSLDGAAGSGSPAEQTVGAIRSESGSAVADTGDVADFDAARLLIQRAVDEFGRLDVLVNAAGILRDRMIFNMEPEEWDAVIRVHLRGAFCTIRHASAYWRAARDGEAQNRIVNFTSDAGQFGVFSTPNYAAAKAGLVGLTHSCAATLRKYGVTTNAILPVATTRMTETMTDEGGGLDASYAPSNVAPAIAYLASTRSGWLNGAVIGAGGQMVSRWAPARQHFSIAQGGTWDAETTGAMMERHFGAGIGERAGA